MKDTLFQSKRLKVVYVILPLLVLGSEMDYTKGQNLKLGPGGPLDF